MHRILSQCLKHHHGSARTSFTFSATAANTLHLLNKKLRRRGSCSDVLKGLLRDF
jgi:hypothetical protein